MTSNPSQVHDKVNSALTETSGVSAPAKRSSPLSSDVLPLRAAQEQRVVWTKKPIAFVRFCDRNLHIARSQGWNRVDYYRHLATMLKAENEPEVPRNPDGSTLRFTQLRSKVETMLKSVTSADESCNDQYRRELYNFWDHFVQVFDHDKGRSSEELPELKERSKEREREGESDKDTEEKETNKKQQEDQPAKQEINFSTPASIEEFFNDQRAKFEKLMSSYVDQAVGSREAITALDRVEARLDTKLGALEETIHSIRTDVNELMSEVRKRLRPSND
uniref:ARAD1A19118p n=1 Tax=Blastobotrys adeninivorans TaxID=409370 RepID=A0A060SZA8_BLAAD